MNLIVKEFFEQETERLRGVILRYGVGENGFVHREKTLPACHRAHEE